MQSYTISALQTLNKREKYLVIGTPCQIDSFRRYLQKFRCQDNFILMDFYCHGIPSRWVWDEYSLQAQHEVGEIEQVAWRDKRLGWHNSYNMQIKGKKGSKSSSLSDGDLFYRLFFSDACLGKACYDRCRFRYNQSSADIRIGDAWCEHYKSNDNGVNIVVTFTTKGDDLLRESDCHLESLPFEKVANGQMKTNPQRMQWYDTIQQLLNGHQDLKVIQAVIGRRKRLERWKHRLLNIVELFKTGVIKHEH